MKKTEHPWEQIVDNRPYDEWIYYTSQPFSVKGNGISFSGSNRKSVISTNNVTEGLEPSFKYLRSKCKVLNV